MEDGHQLFQPTTGAWLQPTGAGANPAAFPLILVLPAARITHAWPGLHVIEVDVLSTFAVGPRLLTCDGTRVAADALIQAHHHSDLCHYFH